MIDQIKLDELKRALDKAAGDYTAKFCVDQSAPGEPLQLAEFDLDLLRDLVKLAEKPQYDEEAVFKAGYNEGWDDCEERAEVTFGGKRGMADKAWNRR